MDAAADYAAFRHLLARDLPAYVSYTVRSHASQAGFGKDETAKLVVRTSDGKIVAGKAPDVKIGTDASYDNDVVKHPPFNPACYAASAARTAQFEGRSVEALSLKGTCADEKSDPDFSTLYLDPSSHEPIAAVGGKTDGGVAVHVEQRFTRVGDFFMPSLFDVRVKGSGIMFWLDVIAHQEYSDYAFSDRMP